MQPLPWTKVPQSQLANTFWEKKTQGSDEEEAAIRAKLNLKELEDFFGDKSSGISAFPFLITTLF